MASIDLQTLNKHQESIKKKHADRVNILKVTKIKIVIKKINKIELEANTRISFFEGIDDVMKEPKIR